MSLHLTLEDVAKALDGKQYREEFTDFPYTTDDLATAGIVVVHGASDDLVEFKGAIYDEVGAYDGGKVYLDRGTQSILENECDDEYCPHYLRLRRRASTINAFWCKEGEPLWTYKTDIPHETFIIMEDENRYCRGIVFYASNI